MWILAFACVVLGFAIGWVLRGRMAEGTDLSGPPPSLTRPAISQRGSDAQTLFASLDPQARAAIEVALSRDKKIEAIKILREATGLGLKESKEAIEALERG